MCVSCVCLLFVLFVCVASRAHAHTHTHPRTGTRAPEEAPGVHVLWAYVVCFMLLGSRRFFGFMLLRAYVLFCLAWVLGRGADLRGACFCFWVFVCVFGLWVSFVCVCVCFWLFAVLCLALAVFGFC